MDPNFYRVTLIAPATQSFCTFPKDYYSAAGDILAVLRYKNIRRPELVQFAEDFFEGKNDGNTDLLRVAKQFLASVETLGEHTATISPVTFTHCNIWDFQSREYADSAEIRYVYLKDAVRYLRCAQITFNNLRCDSAADPKRHIPIRHAWGQPGLMVFDEPPLVYNRLFYKDKVFRSKAELMADLTSPSETNFSLFMEEIMRNG